METPDTSNGDGESRSYLVHVEMHDECPVVLHAKSVDRTMKLIPNYTRATTDRLYR